MKKLNMWWLVAAGAVFLADLFLHLPITDFLDGMVKRFGFVAYDNFMRRGFLALGLGALAVVLAGTGPRKAMNATATAVLLAAALLAQRMLLVAGIENIHYPQYALLTWLLARGGPTPEGAFLFASGLGLADEAYQYLALPRGTPPYFDWNDAVLNVIGAAFGVVAVLVFSRAGVQRPVLSRRHLAAVFCLGSIGALVLSPPVFSPFFSATPGGRLFHRLSAFEAVLIVGGLWMGVRRLATGHVDSPSAVPSVPAGYSASQPISG